MSETLVTILGPTASGKTKLAVELAKQSNGEIISADSRQVYRNMDIGTGKDLSDYVSGGVSVPYHLIDIADAGYKYNVYEYQRNFLTAYKSIVGRGAKPILCGGTGLYIEAVLKGYRLVPVPANPALRDELENKSLAELTLILAGYKNLHNKTDVDTVKRAVRAIEIEEYYSSHPEDDTAFPNIPHIVFGLTLDREERCRRIDKRLKERLEQGMIEEVKALLDSGISAEGLIYYGLEYKYVCLYLTGRLSYDEMYLQLDTAIHQFAKRQMTWFRGMEKRGIQVFWLDATETTEKNVDKIIERISQAC